MRVMASNLPIMSAYGLRIKSMGEQAAAEGLWPEHVGSR